MENEVIGENQVLNTPPDSGSSEEGEKLIPASRVNEIVQHSKLKEQKKMQHEIDRLNAENASLRGASPAINPAVTQGLGNMVDVQQVARDAANAAVQQSDARYQKQREEDNQRREQEQLERETTQVISQLGAKVAAGKGRYEDFDAEVGSVDFRPYPRVLLLASQSDHAADVMYELAKNPEKMSRIEQAYKDSEVNGQKVFNNFVNGIKTNVDAITQAKRETTNLPLDQMRPSTAGADSGGKASFNELKRKYRV